MLLCQRKLSIISLIVIISLTITKVVAEFNRQKLMNNWVELQQRNNYLIGENKKLQLEFLTMLRKQALFKISTKLKTI